MSIPGIAELIIVLIIVAVCWAIPVAAGAWIIVTLHRVHTGQKIIEGRLEEIASALQNRLSQ